MNDRTRFIDNQNYNCGVVKIGTVRVMTFLSTVTGSLSISLSEGQMRLKCPCLQTNMNLLQALGSIQNLAGGLVLVVSRGRS